MKEKFFLPHFSLRFEKKTDVSFDLKIFVTRKIGRAVDRNRIKRVVREFFRRKRGLLQGQSVVCRVAPHAAEARNAELFQELSKIL